MAKDFKAFLKQNVETVGVEKIVISKRFKGADGNPIEWEIRALTSTEDEQIRRSCTKKVKAPGKRNQWITDTDGNEYLCKLVASCIVYPELNDAELQDSYKVMTAEGLLKAMLLPGEYATLVEKVQAINGYDESMDELVDEVKN